MSVGLNSCLTYPAYNNVFSASYYTVICGLFHSTTFFHIIS